MNSIVRFLITFLFVVLLFAVKTAAQTETTVLEVGKPVERFLKEGETHTYKINAAANQFLHVEVDEVNTDVVVSLFSPEGKKLLEVDGAQYITLPERLYALTETAGEYRLEISAAPRAAGVYRVKIAELRPAAPSDDQILKAATAMYEGFRVPGKFELGKPSEHSNAAIEKHLEAITLFRAANNVGGEIDALLHLGNIYVVAGLGRGSLENISKGIEYFEKALELAEKLGDKQRTAIAFLTLGRANFNSRNLPRADDVHAVYMKAKEFYERAFLIYEALGDKYRMWRLLFNKGDIYRVMGEYDNALKEHEKALSVGKTIPNFTGLLASLGNIGNVYSIKVITGKPSNIT